MQTLMALLMGKEGQFFNIYTWRKSYKNVKLIHVNSFGDLIISTEDKLKVFVNAKFVTSVEFLGGQK
ncbi:MAG TPA: hypothetical protein VJ343_02700 [archaeon]|nr:hypothetical protein [archaeon]